MLCALYSQRFSDFFMESAKSMLFYGLKRGERMYGVASWLVAKDAQGIKEHSYKAAVLSVVQLEYWDPFLITT